jgi:hypothetical protein
VPNPNPEKLKPNLEKPNPDPKKQTEPRKPNPDPKKQTEPRKTENRIQILRNKPNLEKPKTESRP